MQILNPEKNISLSLSGCATQMALVHPQGNQIRVVAFNVPQLTQASFLQKNQTLQNLF